jgi:hypothetical protein
MRRFRTSCFLGLFFALTLSLGSQPRQSLSTAPARDPQAINALRQALSAMGGALPADTTAIGTVTIVEGSLTETGHIRILTRGLDQSVEDIEIQNDRRMVVYSRGSAGETRGTTAKPLSFELSLTSQSYDSPLQLLAWAMSGSEAAATYVGLESVNDVVAHHLRLRNVFPASPELQVRVDFTTKDLWIDARTGLPLRLAFERRTAGGAAPRIPLVIDYSAYKVFNGILYPSEIRKTLNGTPWTTIRITDVTINRGLSDNDFQLPAGSAQ